MLLQNVTVTNFCCFEYLAFDQLDRLVILIGENDAGKTAMLDAVELLVSSQVCQPHCYRKLSADQTVDEVIVEGLFVLEPHDTLPDEYRSGPDRKQFFLQKRFTRDRAEVFVCGQGFSDERFDTFSGAANQKALLQEYGLRAGSNEIERLAQRETLVTERKLERVERNVRLPQFAPLLAYLPRVERVASTDYRTPVTLIQQTLRTVAASIISPVDPATGIAHESPNLVKIRTDIEERLNEEVAKAVDILAKINPRLRHIRVEPSIDFTRAVSTGTLSIDIGEGEHLIESFGEGTKRRLWMGLLEWQTVATKQNVTTSVVRLYDEPDVNLHYEAQRQLFASISETATDPSLRTQVFVCTHSVTLVDRAPAQAINLIRVTPEGKRERDKIHASTDLEVVHFLDEVGRAVGLTNTALLFERAFLVVEGPSEAVALPLLYRHLFRRSMREDGIVLINLNGCSAWKAVIQMLLANRLSFTRFLLDADCQSASSSGYLSHEKLEEQGCPPDFLAEQVDYIGTKEFEDIFTDEIIAAALNQAFPLPDAATWIPNTIAEMRACGTKFSSDLNDEVRRSCQPKFRHDAKKPSIALAIANQCVTSNSVPAELVRVFERLREWVGIVKP